MLPCQPMTGHPRRCHARHATTASAKGSERHLARGPGQLAAAHDVQVQVVHRLACGGEPGYRCGGRKGGRSRPPFEQVGSRGYDMKAGNLGSLGETFPAVHGTVAAVTFQREGGQSSLPAAGPTARGPQQRGPGSHYCQGRHCGQHSQPRGPSLMVTRKPSPRFSAQGQGARADGVQHGWDEDEGDASSGAGGASSVTAAITRTHMKGWGGVSG